MRLQTRYPQRRAAVLVEAALVYPVVFLLTIGTIVLILGVFRYQEMAWLAQDGAQWACVHGGMYAQETGNAMATPASVYQNGILPNAVGLDTTKLTYSVTWSDPGEMPTYVSGSNTLPNYVTVTVTYTWVPEAYLGSITFSSTATVAMQY